MIRDLDKYISGLWNWDFISRRLPGKAAVSDIDGFNERNGYMLLLEAKRVGASIPKGQEIAFKNLTASGMVTVVCLWGDTSQPEVMQVWTAGKPGQRVRATPATVASTVSRWYRWASRQPRPELCNLEEEFTI